MSKGKPIYSLREINDLAKAGHVTFSAKATDDLFGLSYTIDEAKDCVAWLSEDEYLKSHDYGGKAVYDAYITKHRHTGQINLVYVKLKTQTQDAQTEVYVMSFHAPEFSR